MNNYYIYFYVAYNFGIKRANGVALISTSATKLLVITIYKEPADGW